MPSPPSSPAHQRVNFTFGLPTHHGHPNVQSCCGLRAADDSCHSEILVADNDSLSAQKLLGLLVLRPTSILRQTGCSIGNVKATAGIATHPHYGGISEVPYEASAPIVDPHILRLLLAHAYVPPFLHQRAATPTFTRQAQNRGHHAVTCRRRYNEPPGSHALCSRPAIKAAWCRAGSCVPWPLSVCTEVGMRLGLVAPLLVAAGFASAAVLVDFQVAQPPPIPRTAKQCTIQILQRTFAFSFGDPEIVQFTPPTDCGPVGSWAGISLNFTVTSNGTQFDRLGIFTFQNVEIWRTSTPEPTRGDGIIWTYLKDVTRFTPLFSDPGTFILQLDNLIETGLDGAYAATLQATFFESSPAHPPAPKADLIIPVTTLLNTTGDDASVPPAFSLNVTVPRNAVEIYAELLPSGNGNEEFWYFNTADEFVNDLPAGFTFPDGPFREVRLLVDGKIAGAANPYPVIFTGGILPTAWRPITSFGALDLPVYNIDLTPFVPVLADGNPHTITIDVVSAESNHTINQNWFVSGNLQVVTDPSGKPTKGSIDVYQANPFAVTSTTGTVSANGDVVVTVKASRTIHIESTIISGSGKVTHAVWSQTLSYTNTQSFLDNLLIQAVQQLSTSSGLGTHNGVTAVIDQYSFPFNVNITSLTPDGSTFEATFDHSYDRTLHPSPFILGSTISERQQAAGFFEETSSGNFGNGTNTNTFQYVDTAGNTLQRQVSSVNTTITSDHQSGSLAAFPAKLKVPDLPLSLAKFSTPRLPGGRKKFVPGN